MNKRNRKTIFIYTHNKQIATNNKITKNINFNINLKAKKQKKSVI